MIPMAVSADVHAHAVGEYPREACGFLLTDLTYIRLTNHSDDPNRFVIALEDQIKYRGRILNVIHSHPHGGPPSHMDRKFCKEGSHDWIVVSLNPEDISLEPTFHLIRNQT